MATILPRKWAGEISAMYMGDNIEAIPTPIPARKRAAMKTSLEGETAIPSDEIANTATAVNKRAFFPIYRKLSSDEATNDRTQCQATRSKSFPIGIQLKLLLQKGQCPGNYSEIKPE
jgi:hypothetical protein